MKSLPIVKESIGFAGNTKFQFILYPEMQVAQFFTIKNINCLELMQSSKFWDKKTPILKDHELVSIDDLTHNEVVLRQLNYSVILKNLT